MISFQPGPSQLWPETAQWFEEGIFYDFFSTYHRSDFFTEVYKKIVELFREKLDLPENYSLYFVSSATECWEILSQNFQGIGFHHTFDNQGAFALKWANYSRKMGNSVHTNVQNTDLLYHYLALTHSETSIGCLLNRQEIEHLQQKIKPEFTFMDATSSMAGLELDWNMADVWFASVQKCFGLPPGLAVLIVSPEALNSCKSTNYYNDLLVLEKNYKQFQTTHTPNLVNIWLLYKSLEHRKPIKIIAEQIKRRTNQLLTILEKKKWNLIVENQDVESLVVFAIKYQNPEEIIQEANKQGIQLGLGYGDFKKSSFRIANFPAITDEQWDYLCHFIENLPLFEKKL